MVIRNLPAECDDAQLKKTLERFGLVVYCKLLKGRENGSLACAFVQFYKAAEANMFIEAFNGMQIGRKTVEVRISDEFNYSAKSLYMRNFHPKTTEGQLFSLFSRYGMILTTSLKENNGKRFGFVEFTTSEAAANAICDLNSRKMEGYEWIVTYFECQKERYSSLNQSWSERNVVIYGLPSDTNECQVGRVCTQFGAIESLCVKKRGEKVTGFVCFRTCEGAEKALKGPIDVLGVRTRATMWVQKEAKGIQKEEAGKEQGCKKQACLYIA